MEEERLISEFNEAKFQIYRLHYIWLECKKLRESGKIIKYKWKLDSALIELNFDAERLDELDATSYVSDLKKLDEEIEDAENGRKLNLLYKKLLEKEKLLRKIQEACGKGAKFRLADEISL